MDFSDFRLTKEDREELLATQDECSISWLNDENWPVTIIQTFLWERDALWVTVFRDKPRVEALRARPRAAISVSSKGTELGPERMVSARVLATIHEDDETKSWFYLAFSARATPNERAAKGFAKALAAQDRVIIELRPQPGSWTSFDGMAMRRGVTRQRAD
jgi:hypothetical protein